MTKKHFIALADALKESKPEFVGESQPYYMDQWEADVRAIAKFCRSQNPNFNRERWLSYINGKSGPGGGTIKEQPKP